MMICNQHFKGAYVLAIQAPNYWCNDYTNQAKAIIDQAVKEFGIKQVFVSGLSAGGLMSQRMLAKYGDYFDGALLSCSAIAKNNQYVEALVAIMKILLNIWVEYFVAFVTN